MVYAVTYNLNTPGRDYRPLYEELKRSERWWHFLESTWLVSTNETATLLSNRLVPHITQNDRLLVIEVRNNAQGWLTNDAWTWIHQNVQR